MLTNRSTKSCTKEASKLTEIFKTRSNKIGYASQINVCQFVVICNANLADTCNHIHF